MRDTLLFDLDGTLVDTAPDLVRATNDAIAVDGHPARSVDSLRNGVGFGARWLITEAHPEALSDARLDALLCTFMESYVSGIADQSRPFDGVVETLSSLKRDGHVLSVCTNKPGELARNLIEQLGLTALFDRIIGSTDVPRAKPHSDHVFNAAGHRERHRMILVGDSSVDMLAARNAKIPGVLVTYGYNDQPADTLKPTAMMRSFRELPELLGQL